MWRWSSRCLALPVRIAAEWDPSNNKQQQPKSVESSGVIVSSSSPSPSSQSNSSLPPNGWLFETDENIMVPATPPGPSSFTMETTTTSALTTSGAVVDQSSLGAAKRNYHSGSGGLPLPEDVNPMSPLHAKWQCVECSKKWFARISDRCNPSTDLGCPACTLKRVADGGGVGTEARVIPASADYSEGSIDTKGSVATTVGVHRWVSSSSSPKKVVGVQLLVDAFPKVAGEWSEEKNQTVTSHELHLVASDASFEAWWNCFRCREHWRSSVVDRCHGPMMSDGRRGAKTTCPTCADIDAGTVHHQPPELSSRKSSKKGLTVGTLGAERPDLVNQVIGFGVPSIKMHLLNMDAEEEAARGGRGGVSGSRSELRLRKIREEVSKLPLSTTEQLVWQCATCATSFKDSVRRRIQGFNCPSCSPSGGADQLNELPAGSEHRSVVALRPDVFKELCISANNRKTTQLANVVPITSSRVFSFRCQKCGQIHKMSMRERCFNYVEKFGCPQCRFVGTVSGSAASATMVNQPAYNMATRRTTSELAKLARNQGRIR